MLFKKFSLKNIEIDEKIKQTMKIGLYISATLSIVASIILFTYLTFGKKLIVYYFGLMVLKLSTILATAFVISGLSVDKIRKDLF